MPVNSFENYPMSWRPQIERTKSSLYLTIAQTLEKDIRTGILKPNDKLPPQRELADYLDVNLSTITRAFKLCEAKGLICGNVGRGTYVAADIIANAPMLFDTSPNNNVIELGASHPLYEQNKYIAPILKRITTKFNIENLLKYYDISGTYQQKESGRLWLEMLGIPVKTENILVTSGLQNSLSIILSSLFEYGDKIAVNCVIYPGFKNLANMFGLKLFPIPYNGQRMDLDYLDKLCKNEKIKGIYLTPDIQNPTAITMDKNERENASAIIRRYKIICIEDGTYTFLSGSKYPALYTYIQENTIHICTVSNSISAGLRISYLVSPLQYREKILSGIRNINVMSSPIDSEIVSQLIQTKAANTIINEKISEIQRRNTVVNHILNQYEIWGDLNSQFRWLLLPSHMRSQEVEDVLLTQNVQVFCSDRFAVARASFRPALRLAVSSPKTIQELEIALQIIDTFLSL